MIQQPGPCHEYAKETRETLPPRFLLQLQPSLQPSPPRATPCSAAAFASLILGLGLSAHLMFTEKKKKTNNNIFKGCELFFLCVKIF